MSIHEKENTFFVDQVLDYQKHLVAALTAADRTSGSKCHRQLRKLRLLCEKVSCSPHHHYVQTAPLPPVLSSQTIYTFIALLEIGWMYVKMRAYSIAYRKFHYKGLLQNVYTFQSFQTFKKLQK